VESIVTRKTYHRAEGNSYRIEDLRCSVDPDLINSNDTDIINFN